VAVQDASAAFAQVELFGPGAAALLGETIPASDEVREQTLGGVALRVIGTDYGFLLLVPAGDAAAVEAWLAEAGAAPVTQDTMEILRVEAGRPSPAHELTEDYTPLEMNLGAAVSDTKGCYTGQEVIARQITYDKITKRLVGVRLDAPVNAGAAVLAEDRRAGEVTSAVESPRLGPIALAVIKRPHFDPGTPVTLNTAEGAVGGTVVALPFE
jgi:folate-binding protein YgfZ